MKPKSPKEYMEEYKKTNYVFHKQRMEMEKRVSDISKETMRLLGALRNKNDLRDYGFKEYLKGGK